MSKLLISQYLNDLARLKQVSGSVRESVVREAFKDLLKGYGRSHDLVFVPEFEIETPAKERRYVDGDHKNKVIDLLLRVNRVRVETQAIVTAIQAAAR
jgi:hypothetical protein